MIRTSDSSTDREFLAGVAGSLAAVEGIRAIVLGGSRATGTADAWSDYDIGLYYTSPGGLDIAVLRVAVARLEGDARHDAVTGVGEWGPWINGGGWLTIGDRRVDLLYRDLDKVRSVIEECVAGDVSVHYQPGHPHAFVSAIYCGEVAECLPLFDGPGEIAALKRRALPYPPALAAALTQRFLWEADFAIANARKSAERGDIAYVAGCSFRAVACLCQVLFAVNGRYLLNEKGAVARAATLPLKPTEFGKRTEHAFGQLCRGDLTTALSELQQLSIDTAALAGA